MEESSTRRKKKKFLLFTDIRVLNDTMFNILDATEPRTVEGSGNILIHAIQNISVEKLLALFGSRPIIKNQIFTNTNIENRNYTKTKSREQWSLEQPPVRTGSCKEEKGGIIEIQQKCSTSRTQSKNGNKESTSVQRIKW